MPLTYPLKHALKKVRYNQNSGGGTSAYDLKSKVSESFAFVYFGCRTAVFFLLHSSRFTPAHLYCSRSIRQTKNKAHKAPAFSLLCSTKDCNNEGNNICSTWTLQPSNRNLIYLYLPFGSEQLEATKLSSSKLFSSAPNVISLVFFFFSLFFQSF